MSEGEIIKKLIKESGLSVAEIAKKIEVDRRTVYSYMKKGNLKPDVLKRLSVACGKNPNYLLKRMLNEDPDEGLTSDDGIKYRTNSKEIAELNNENKKLLKKLVELQEKHIKLQEEYLNLKRSKRTE